MIEEREKENIIVKKVFCLIRQFHFWNSKQICRAEQWLRIVLFICLFVFTKKPMPCIVQGAFKKAYAWIQWDMIWGSAAATHTRQISSFNMNIWGSSNIFSREWLDLGRVVNVRPNRGTYKNWSKKICRHTQFKHPVWTMNENGSQLGYSLQNNNFL